MDKNKIIKLDQYCSLSVKGEGAKELLQGQITCDVERINASNFSLGSICNVKGRVISSFLLLKGLVKDEFLLIGPEEMMFKTSEVLKKYSPFYKVNISANNVYKFYAATDQITKELFSLNSLPTDNEAWRKEGIFRSDSSVIISYLDKEFNLLLLSENDFKLVKDSLNQSFKLEVSKYEKSFELSTNDSLWQIDNINNFEVEISIEMTEKYTPHELHYIETGRIDFSKGCFTGQEVIARMHYRAKTLPKVYLAECDSNEIKENMVICDEKNKKVGNLIKATNLPSKSICLISTKEKNLGSPLKIRETDSKLNMI